MTWDAGTRTAQFKLVAGPFKYDGFSAGGGTLRLPPQSNVVINFVNKDGTPHSAVVIDGGGALPNMVSDPVIPGAYTVTPLQGLAQEGKDVMRFKVPDTGTYRIACGVPGHALSGMWIWMKVDASATTATFGPTK